MKPTPVVTVTICSLCGEDWGAHGAKPTSEDCVKLLLAKVRGLEAQRPIVINRPWYVPTYPPPVVTTTPYNPVWYSRPYVMCESTTHTNTPAIAATCRAVAA